MRRIAQDFAFDNNAGMSLLAQQSRLLTRCQPDGLESLGAMTGVGQFNPKGFFAKICDPEKETEEDTGEETEGEEEESGNDLGIWQGDADKCRDQYQWIEVAMVPKTDDDGNIVDGEYEWKPISGAARSSVVDPEGESTTHTIINPAVEINGEDDITNGDIVWMWPDNVFTQLGHVEKLTAGGKDYASKRYLFYKPSPKRGIIVQNDTGNDRSRYEVCGVGDPLVDGWDDKDKPEFPQPCSFKVVVPHTPTHVGKFVVLLEDIKSGERGRAAILDVVKVKTYAASSADESLKFADIDDGTMSHLKLAPSGSAQVLYRESGTGEKWAIVRLGNPRASFPILCTAQTTGVVAKSNGTFTVNNVTPVVAGQLTAGSSDTYIIDNSVAKWESNSGTTLDVWITDQTEASPSKGHGRFAQGPCKGDT